MTITVELPPEIEARFLAQAKERGLSLDAYVREFLSVNTTAPALASRLSPDDINRLLDEAAELVPAGVAPLSDYAMSRESIYARENEW